MFQFSEWVFRMNRPTGRPEFNEQFSEIDVNFAVGNRLISVTAETPEGVEQEKWLVRSPFISAFPHVDAEKASLDFGSA